MSSFIQPYLFFNGTCQEALAFYETALGAKTEMLMRYDQSPDSPPPGMLAEGWEKKVMHASLRIGESVIMASDGCGPDETFSGFALSLTAKNEAEAGARFEALAAGGEIAMPLGKTFWSPCFGMVKDRFGVSWMVTVPDAT